MQHLSHLKDRAQATPPEWLPTGAQIGTVANGLADRTDIVVYVGPGAGAGAPACFAPLLAELEIDVLQAFGKGVTPAMIGDIRERAVQFDYPVAMGAITHEAGHAAFTRWDLEEQQKHKHAFERELIVWFEESRIESLILRKHPDNREFMRSCAIQLVMDELLAQEKERIAKGEERPPASIIQLSQLLLLTLARVDAGVLDPDDVETVREQAERVLGPDVLEKLRAVWKKAQDHHKHEEWRPLLDRAKEWIEILKDSGNDPEEEMEAASAAMMAAVVEAIEGALGDMAEDVEVQAIIAGHEQEKTEADREERKEREAISKERKDHEDVAGKVFGQGTADVIAGSQSRLQEERPPTSAERAAAVTVARLLEKARYRDRVVTRTRSELPPGRFDAREAMQGSVQRQRGGIVTAEPFTDVLRRHVEDPEFRMGAMVDISGSMSAAMEPMATMAWVFSEAGRRIEAKVAMVYYGNAVFPVLRTGQHLRKVRVYSAPDGTERFDKAFKALNGEVGLLGGSGARMLVIVSDLHYTPNEVVAARKWIKRLIDDGVAVVVLPPNHYGYDNAGVNATELGATVIPDVLEKATTAATTIGRHAARAIENAGNRRG